MILPQKYSKLDKEGRKAARKEYAKLQDGICIHCKRPLNLPASKAVKEKKINWKLFPKGFLDHPIHLHHDHKTDLTLGVVHNYCNAVLWQYYGE